MWKDDVYTYIYIYMYVCVFVCIHVCMHVCIRCIKKYDDAMNNTRKDYKRKLKVLWISEEIIIIIRYWRWYYNGNNGNGNKISS